MLDEVREIESQGCRISTRVTGSGPLVNLIHGWPELGLSWRDQVLPLAEAGFTVATPDLRGFGKSSKPDNILSYRFDIAADDMAAIADALGHEKWVSIGHGAGSMVAWRTALRFPDRVAAVFSLSVPYLGVPPMPVVDTFDIRYPNRFFYMRYFQKVGVAEAELEVDARDSLKRIFYSLSGAAPKFDWTRERPIDDPLLKALTPPPPGPLSFMSDDALDTYADAYEKGGFFAPLCWYRTFEADYVDMQAYGDGIIRQPSGFLCGDKEILLDMYAHVLDRQRGSLSDMRRETILPGAGHWIQQERPWEVTRALLDFLNEVREELE
ncbi:alpha/beta hydrolase [Sphingobium sp.]|uniref:alpha/beta hydrolase n=1 Tax=Sphingobium sp. TaxID=1912891 RepID=UPI0028BDB13C|nr:alpha/beta hydrolase [Sphingobium sp.]